MRTTLTLDDDVSVELNRLRRLRNASYKQLVNEALRAGLREMATSPRRPKRFRTEPADLGRPLIPNFDNVAEVLALIEGDAYK